MRVRLRLGPLFKTARAQAGLDRIFQVTKRLLDDQLRDSTMPRHWAQYSSATPRRVNVRPCSRTGREGGRVELLTGDGEGWRSAARSSDARKGARKVE